MFSGSPYSLKTLLGGLTPAQFLDEYWQKKPLLIRQAIPEFAGFLTWSEAQKLAADENVESRLIQKVGREWQLDHGPFPRSRFKALAREKLWTVLIQDLNIHHPAADELLRAFSFIPWARVDDVMVSFATPGAGVGPHVDSYDVFLIQGPGQRRWQISRQSDLSLRPDLPLKILKKFQPEEEWILNPGDMLYLPPNYAHDGVALNDCFTYSIGFRAPSNQEWLAECLMDRAERETSPGHFADPDRRVTRHPGELPMDMVRHLKKLLDRLSWSTEDLIDFNGRFISEPKAHVFFDGVESPVSLAKFKKIAIKQGLECNPKTRMVYRGAKFWCNGEAFAMSSQLSDWITALADRRSWVPGVGQPDLEGEDWHLLYDLYCQDWVRLRA